MHFWSKCFYLIYIFSYIEVGSWELEFHVIALGHSGLLIYWDPPEVNYIRDFIYFTSKALTSKQGALHQTAVENTEEQNETDVWKGQYKINSLDEDTEYEIRAAYHDHSNTVKNYTIKCKTTLKNNSPPEQPYFTLEVGLYVYKNRIKITWLPCGKERNCLRNEAGTHFAVKYKKLDSRETVKIIQYSGVTQEILDIYPGKIYEITVLSINGNSETPSDSQEIFLKPCSSPVNSVKVLTLTSTSIYVSWKMPKWSTHDEFEYALFISKLPEMSELPSKQYETTGFTQTIIRNLTQEIIYTFTILPLCSTGCGFEYRFDYSIKAIQSNLPLAKPDFKLERSINHGWSCEWSVVWIPCPEISDCKNMSFSSDCEIKIQDSDYSEIYSCIRDGFVEKGFVEIDLKKNRTFQFIGKSVNEFNQTSDSVYKRISCKGFEDE